MGQSGGATPQTLKRMLLRKFYYLSVATLQPLRYSVALGCVALLLLFSGCQSITLTAPEQFYDTVWQSVDQQFVDTKTNHQDWQIWRHRYDGRLETMPDAYLATETMLASLNDDYTRLLQPNEMQNQTMNIDAHLFGVGLHIAIKNKHLIVVSPMPGTPASKAGFKPLDYITHINGQPTQGLPIEEAAKRIRGPKDTQVTLTVRRLQQVFTQTLTRAEIKLPAVEAHPVPNNPDIGYIRLSTFISENAPHEFETAVRQFADKKGLIIDLRDNYGGLLSNAVAISDMFLDKGRIVNIEDRGHNTQHYAALPGQLFTGPMVVLINGGSASASEIFAGAMQDLHRAKLLGTKSFGKGLVQRVLDLPEQAGLNMTIARYTTPSGRDINTRGITPDITVPLQHMPTGLSNDAQVQAALTALRRT